jgi:hypothetical protein
VNSGLWNSYPQIAVAVVLLVATGLMVKSFRNLISQPWGFATDQRLVFNVAFSDRLRPDHAARTAYLDQALEKLRALPGVISATATTPDVVSFGRNLAAVTPQGSTPPAARGYFLINHRLVTPGYFRDSGMRIVRGRDLADTDRADGQKVAVITETFAKNFWPGEDPIGKTIKRGRADDPRPPYVVVGVVADIRGTVDSTDGDLPGLWFLPYAQNPNYLTNNLTFVLHTHVPPESLQAAARAALGKVDAQIAPYEFNTLSRMVDDTYVEDRFALLLGPLEFLSAREGCRDCSGSPDCVHPQEGYRYPRVSARSPRRLTRPDADEGGRASASAHRTLRRSFARNISRADVSEQVAMALGWGNRLCHRFHLPGPLLTTVLRLTPTWGAGWAAARVP